MDLNKELALVEIANKYWEAKLSNDKEGMKYWGDFMDKFVESYESFTK
jgi:hypothetical protein